MANINTAIASWIATNAANVSALETVVACVKAQKIKNADALRPLVLAQASKHYSVPLKTAERGTRMGEKALDPEADNYEAARKAVNRLLAKVSVAMEWKEPGGHNHTDVVQSVYTKLEKMDGRSRNRLIRMMREAGWV